jgi:hypothetical protein
VRSSASDNYRFETLITNIVLSDAFLKARVPVTKEATDTPLQAAVAN